jgi:hypothetical protein
MKMPRAVAVEPAGIVSMKSHTNGYLL